MWEQHPVRDFRGALLCGSCTLCAIDSGPEMHFARGALLLQGYIARGARLLQIQRGVYKKINCLFCCFCHLVFA
jgi:hypothetical protein